MQRFLMIKLAMIGLLCVLFVVALLMINGLVYERKSYENQVIEEIAQTQIGTQTVTTPFIVIQKDGKFVPILPTKSDIHGDLAVHNNQYARGIYKATSYQGVLTVAQSYQGEFSTPKASLVIPISDLRGVSLPMVTINGKSYPTKFGDGTLTGFGDNKRYLVAQFGLDVKHQASEPAINQAVNQTPKSPTQAHTTPVPLATPPSAQSAQTVPQSTPQALPTPLSLDIAFKIDVAGLSTITMIPLGDNSQFSLSGDWQEPKFYGDALPIEKTLNDTGFMAKWQTPFLSQKNGAELLQNFQKCHGCRLEQLNAIRTDFVKMDNPYIKTDRTIKYGLMLLLVSFGTFFLFEIIKGLKIHPVQYLLVSAGLLTFYVLLLSFAELIVFWQAYLIASLACVGLITWYASFLLKSVGRSVLFGGILGGLYAGFYVILSVGEMNLLLGAIFCFALLFVVMFITRKIDWYQLTDNKFIQPSEKHCQKGE